MKTTYKDLERQNVLHLASEYEEKGYQVVIEPNPESLPPFLKEYHPDLIARNGKDNVVVEVMSFATVVNSDKLSELAQAIQETPEWRLELVMVNPKPSRRVGSGPEAGIQERLETVSQLRDEGYFQAALIALLSALEATLELSDAATQASRKERPASAIARSLHKQGRLSPEEYKAVTLGLNLRNSILPIPADQTMDIQLLDKLLPVVRAILESLGIADNQPSLMAA